MVILFTPLLKLTIIPLLFSLWLLIMYRATRPRVLLIDDKRNIKATLVCRTYDEGLSALKSEKWQLLYLDHDLGCYDENGREKTGYDIMCFLEEYPQYLPEKIMIVSSNPVGRKRMQVVIDKLYGDKS